MADYRKRIVDSILQDRLEVKGADLIKRLKWCGKRIEDGQSRDERAEPRHGKAESAASPQGRGFPSHRRVAALVQPWGCRQGGAGRCL